MKWRSKLFLISFLAVSSCARHEVMDGDIDDISKKNKSKPMSSLDAYRAAGGRVSGIGAEGAGMVGGGSTMAPAAGITPESEIAWAPEDPNQPIPGEEIWQRPENKSWYVSHTEAMRYARQSGKPVLIWFTDSARSPVCRRLSEELFSQKSFASWAGEHLIRLRVDSGLEGGSKLDDLGTRKLKFIEKLKRRYSVHGHPTVVMISPRGNVMQSYRGYQKGNADYYWGRIKQAVAVSGDDYGKWRERLEKRGYRMWESRDGQKTLAKLALFQSGKVTLIDPDGNRASTRLSRLSDADQAWIMNEKKRYESNPRR